MGLGLGFIQRVRIGINATDDFLAPLGTIELDASIDESHTAVNEITEFPVEVGINITDHVRRQPDRVTIRGIVTDHPIQLGGALRSGRSLEAYQDFLVMLNQADLVIVVTTLRQYSNMIVESMTVPRTNTLGGAVEFTLVLREILTAEIALALGTTNLGTQNTTVVA